MTGKLALFLPPNRTYVLVARTLFEGMFWNSWPTNQNEQTLWILILHQSFIEIWFSQFFRSILFSKKFRTISKRYYRLIQTMEILTREPITECPTTWLTLKARVKESIITSIDGKARAFFAPQSNVCFSSQNIVWGNALKQLTHKSKMKTSKICNWFPKFLLRVLSFNEQK